MCNQSNGGVAYLDITQLIMAEYKKSPKDMERLGDSEFILMFELCRDAEKNTEENNKPKEEMFRVGEIIDIISQEQLSKKATKEQRQEAHYVNDTMKGVIKKLKRGKYYASIRLLDDGIKVLSNLCRAEFDEIKVGMKVHCKHSPTYGWIIYDVIADVTDTKEEQI
jgi:hypothetical protein